MSVDQGERHEMVTEFVTESREMLDNIEPQILELEKRSSVSGAVDDEILNTVFRLFHSLKGMAAFLDLGTVINVTHEAETLLDIFRKKQMPIKTEHVELLYRTSDFIRGLMDVIEKQLNDSGYEADAELIISDIKGTISAGNSLIRKTLEAFEPVKALEPNSEESEPAFSEFQLTITPALMKRFADESLEVFEEAESALLQLEGGPHDDELIEQVFRSFHSFKGNAGFFEYSDFEKLSHKAESILEVIRDAQKAVSPAIISGLLTVVDTLRTGVMQLENSGGKIKGLKKTLAMLDRLDVTADNIAIPEDKKKLVSLSALDRAEYIEPDNEEVHEDQDDGKELDPEYIAGSAPGGAGRRSPKGDDDRNIAASSQIALRVDVEKLDQLLDLVGEMVIAVSMVGNNPDLAGQSLDRFDKSMLHLTKITRDIQDVSMSMRMIPVAGLFRKMVRLVRDLSMKEKKKVDLEIIGEETEVDKTIIEQISDPLVHLIRNSVDHGIELPADRQAAGKPESGRLTLEAKHSAGEVWILVKDDGKGLDREKILRKAIEKGLVGPEAKDWKDEDVWKLIFEPGLSTAAQVSSLSGRGVGMDVVRRNIEKLRGRIDIRSQIGQGTSFVIRIPLTLAIIDGMIVKVGDVKYTIPITSIKESLRPVKSQITMTPEGLEILNVRGALLPIIRIHEIYNVKSIQTELSSGILIIVESDTKQYCLFVDEVLGQQQIVIKGIPSYFGTVRGVSGFAILGDGEVSTILDVTELVNSVEGLLDEVNGE